MPPVWSRTRGQLGAQSGPSNVDTRGFPSTIIWEGNDLYRLIRSTTWESSHDPAAMLKSVGNEP